MSLNETALCKEGGGGSLLPFVQDEFTWTPWVRALLYAVGMIYMFLGVSIVADMFMNSIEEITSRSKQVTKKDGRVITYKVWNPTVANLTLLALGSSAPEILLSVIRTSSEDFFVGGLGSATITGSASFNLLVIVGLCMVVIPSDELRRMKDMEVFIVTVVLMFFAYIWLAVIVVFITPEVIDIWEAVVTLLGEPVLVYIAYLADVGSLRRCRRGPEASEEDALVKRALKMLGLEADDEDHQNTKIVLEDAVKEDKSGFRKVVDRGLPADREKISSVVEAGMAARESRVQRRAAMARIRRVTRANFHLVKPVGEGRPQVQFAVVQQSLSSELAVKTITVVRMGDHTGIGTITGSYVVLRPKEFISSPSASSLLQSVYVTDPDNYEGSMEVSGRGSFVLAEGEMVKDVPVEIVRQTPWKLLQEVGCMDWTASHKVVPAYRKGVFSFAYERIAIPGASHAQTLQTIVERLDGCSGPARCNYRTTRLSSAAWAPLSPSSVQHELKSVRFAGWMMGWPSATAQGVLEFPPGVTERFIEIEILPKQKAEIADKFLLILDEAEGAKFDRQEGGSRDSQTQTVMIGMNEQDEGASKWLDATFNCDEVSLGMASWREQFNEAIFCNGSWEEQKQASCFDFTFHLISLPWKLFFFPVPPKIFLGGWACFMVSLGYIAFLTAVIGDMAEIFGCVLEIPDLVTGISFDPTADAAIINVTGSNSVNVFLGLGLPWTVAAVIWAVRGQTEQWLAVYSDIGQRDYMRDRGALVIRGAEELFFSVIVFAAMAALALIVVLVRRKYVGGELGGPFWSKVLGGGSLLVFWFSYIGLVSWYSITGKTSSADQLALVISLVFALCIFFTIATAVVTIWLKGLKAEEEEEEADAGFIQEIQSPKSEPGKLTDADALAPKCTSNVDDLVLPGPKLIQEPLPERVMMSEKSSDIEAQSHVAAEARQAVRLHPAPPHPQLPRAPPQPDGAADSEEPKNVAMSLESAAPTWRPTEEDAAYQTCPVYFLPAGCRAACCSLTASPDEPRSCASGTSRICKPGAEGSVEFRDKALEAGALELVLTALQRHISIAQVQEWQRSAS
eukprot:g2609.t1